MNKIIITGASAALFLATTLPAMAYVPTHAGVAASATTTVGTHATTAATTTVKAKKPVLKTLQGKVKMVNANSLVLTVGSKDYTAQLSATTKILDRVRKTVSLVDISTGDTVRVYGAVSGSVVTAQIVRDTSIPLAVKTTTSTTTSTTLH